MTIKDRFASFKERNRLDNADIAIYTLAGVGAVGFLALFIYAGREEIKLLNAQQDWMRDVYESGRVPLELANGTLVAVDDYEVFLG